MGVKPCNIIVVFLKVFLGVIALISSRDMALGIVGKRRKDIEEWISVLVL